MHSTPLRLGILLSSTIVPAWAFESLERIARLPSTTFSLIVVLEAVTPRTPWYTRLWNNRHHLLYLIFNQIDTALLMKGSNALLPKSTECLFSHVPILTITPSIRDAAAYVDPSDLSAIIDSQLDILIDLTFKPLRGAILTAARYGVWSPSTAHFPPGLFEVAHRLPETSSVLRILSDDIDDSRTLNTSSLTTYHFSPAHNCNRSLWATSLLLPRQIALLQRLSANSFPSMSHRDEHRYRSLFTNNTLSLPSTRLTLTLILRVLFNISSHLLYKLCCLDTWYLLIAFAQESSLSFAQYRPLLPPKDRFWADPHVIKLNSDYYVFVEEYIYRNHKGHLSVIKLDQHGCQSAPVKILEKSYHLSYPFVFAYNDSFYLIPESADNRTIDLYRCVHFPDKWIFVMSLMDDVKAVDTTVLFYQRKWWLFTGLSEHEATFPDVELFLFFSDDLFTNKWTPHPYNPIVSDVKRARPAGRVFVRNGKLFRPSQDCSKMYGYGCDLNEIVTLTDTEYREEMVTSIRPTWDKTILATHTYATEGELTVIDVFTRRQKLRFRKRVRNEIQTAARQNGCLTP